MSVWKSDETLLSICILNFSFKNDFVWEVISNIRHSVSSPDETPRSSSKIFRCASYFQLSSRCFIWWWNTASHVWYITSNIFKIKVSNVLWQFLTGLVTSKNCDCPVECEQVLYSSSLSSAFFPSTHYWDSIYQLLNDSFTNKTKVTITEVQEAIRSVTI